MDFVHDIETKEDLYTITGMAWQDFCGEDCDIILHVEKIEKSFYAHKDGTGPFLKNVLSSPDKADISDLIPEEVLEILKFLLKKDFEYKRDNPEYEGD